MSTGSAPALPSAALQHIQAVLHALYPDHQVAIAAVKPLTKAISSSSVWLVELACAQSDTSSSTLPPPSVVVRLLQDTHAGVQQQTQIHAAVLQLIHRQLNDRQSLQRLPTILHSDDHMVVESCIAGIDLISVTDIALLADDFWLQLGQLLAQVHSVDVSRIIGSGPLQACADGSMLCRHGSFTVFIDSMWRQRLATAVAADLLSSSEAAPLSLLLHAMTPLVWTHGPEKRVLLHADVNSSNLRAVKKAGRYEFAGLIDFGDSMIGDPMFDCGRLYSHQCSNALFAQLDYAQRWHIIQQVLHTSQDIEQPCSRDERRPITYYALWYTLWLLTLFGPSNEATKSKYRNTLLTLQWELSRMQFGDR